MNRPPNPNGNKLNATGNRQGFGHSFQHGNTRPASPYGIASQITAAASSSALPVLSSSNTLLNQSSSSLTLNSSSSSSLALLGVSTTKPIDVAKSETIKEEVKDELVVDPQIIRNKVLQSYFDTVEDIKVNFKDRLQELFFIQSGGNMVDYPAWKVRPTPHLMSFMNVYRLDDNTSLSTSSATNAVSQSVRMQSACSTASSSLSISKHSDHSNRMNSKPSVEQYGFVQGMHEHGNKHRNIKHEHRSFDKSHSNRHGSTSGATQDDIAGQVRHESETLHRISQLRKTGLWSASRLPKVYELARKKTHWDFLLEEMQWLATDFTQEKKWKRNMARKISRSVMKFHQDRLAHKKRVKKEEISRMKRIASGIAKEVKQFWQQVEKVACYKQQSRQEEQRRKALDLHLNFIVDQTEKYSSWLVEGMRESSVSSPISSRNVSDGDDEFEPTDSANMQDDEATISEEEDNEDQGKYDDELDALKEESEIPIEDLIDNLPEDMLNRLVQSKDDLFSSDDENESESDDEKSDDGSRASNDDESDSEDYVADEEMVDDEATIDVEEKHGDVDHQTEIDDLQKEGELPISELLRLYGNPSATNLQEECDSDDEESEESEEDDEPMKSDSENASNAPADTDKTLTEKVPDDELTSAAATAESLQPKGFTLSTTQVKTKVPFLLQHILREYQHIGLDWLVTMYSKQLNGILADEMGLGKTIQTIALLAHLACEEECWGPHLIVVPTSVMLNWEFELKKWCPGFKILTYFGTQKERKLKRAGWSKPNAFHVCITSYKLVIQDHQAFRRRKWKYLILDEAQNIKNFKSQRWQTLLNFHSQRRLLLTGTPLQNSLMELWSLMHFLMPNIFQSHQDFKEWFSNPLTGMIEGSREYSESIIKRLHTVLRPFLLRRLKAEVELQMPKKYEHVVKCRLSKRQRFLYDEFMSRTKTKETLEAGNFLSVINILMQLRKVCNHPDLFELRPVFSPFIMDELQYQTASIVHDALNYDPFLNIDLSSWNFTLANLELSMSAFQAHRTNQLKVDRVFIEELSSSSSRTDDLQQVDDFLPLPRKYRTSSSQFQPLANVSEEVMTALPEMESGRSYLDVINVNSKNYGVQTVSDILLRQIEDSIDSADIDVVNVDGEQDDDVLLQPVSKKPKIEVINAEPVKGKLLEEYITTDVSPFHLPKLKETASTNRLNCFTYMTATNDRHCDMSPVYGTDLHEAVQLKGTSDRFIGALLHQFPRECMCSHLQSMVLTPTCRVNRRKPITDRYSLYVRPVVAPVIALRTSHISPSKRQASINLVNGLKQGLAGKVEFLTPAMTHSIIQFPETRLVQYDCGKLQALDQLLRELKYGKHRVLIFTQMTKMLDVLERFLNYHGYIYVRLDGTTKVEQRQVLMERFNQDEKIFVFILSTRSGGIGVNLTGADTVIFYDSDWNPTMDAQAQDRCHRIGQTRDVHIYRLICDRTVEENILKKAHQKKLLGNIAIEGGNFTTSFFKQDSVKDLFNVGQQEEPGNIKDVIVEEKVSKVVEEEKKEDNIRKDQKLKNNQYEEVLAKAEEDEDVKAAQTAKAEEESELMEFNENVPYVDGGKNESSKVEEALASLESELKPIELFALRFMESTKTFLVEDEVEEAEKVLEQKKKEWELDRLQSMKEEEERKNAQEEDDMFFTYVRDETYAKHFVDEYTGVLMPVWTPPTPPRDGETEFVTDHCLAFLYETGTIPENHLPPTHYLKKGGMDLFAMKRNTDRSHYLSVFKKKRHRLSKHKSIFDKKALELLNKSKLKKSQKLKQKAMTVPVTSSSVTTRPDYSQQGPDWLINEDWALLQAVNTMSELPLDFQNEPVHNKLANWDLAADIVNSTSRIRRSARQCRDRYQNVILLREEGKLMTTPDATDVKMKKNKKAMQQFQPPKAAALPHPQPKTHPQFNQDRGKGVLNMHYSKFDSVKKAALKRKPTIKQPNASKFQGSRHAQILAANGISTDKTLNPRELANMRADRIANEKKQAVVAAQQLQQQTTASSINTTSQTQSVLSGRTSQSANIPVGAVAQLGKGVTVGVVQASNAAGSIRGNLVFTSSGGVGVGSSTLVVNPSGISVSNSGLSTTAASFAAINRKMQNVTHNVVSMGQVPSAAAIGSTARILNAQAGAQTTQIIPGLVHSKNVSQPVAVSSTPSSVVAPNAVARATIAGTVGSPGSLITTQPFIQGKALTQHQIAILRQKAAQQQQQHQLQKLQQQRLQQQKQLKLIQQQSQQTSQSQLQASQTTKQVQPTIVATSHQLGSLTVQTMKAPVTLRGSVPQQIMTQPLTAAQQQQLLQQALKKQQIQQLQQRGQLTSNSQIQQMLAGQKLTQHQLQQLQQQQQRHSQLQQQQQLKFQQQVTATIVTQPKAQLLMTQVKAQGGQSVKTSGQQIQLQQLQQAASAQGSLPQQILLRPTLTQGLPQQIQLRAMISQQSPQQIQRVTAGQAMQAMQAQVNLQTGTVVMQPQQISSSLVMQPQASTHQQLSSAQVQVVSSLAQQQQRNIQAAVQKQVQQQQQQSKMAAVGTISSTTTKPTQVHVQLQQNSQLSQQLQRQQVLSATPAQLSQVKAFVSQAQLQASLSRSNSPVGPAITNQSTASAITTTQNTASPLTTSIQLQAQQVSQQMRNPQLVQVQLKTSDASTSSVSHQQQQLKQQQLKQQLQQLQAQAVKQQLRQSLPVVVSQASPIVKSVSRLTTPATTPTATTPTAENTIIKPTSTSHVEVETLGAETELTTDESQDKGDDMAVGLRSMRTRSHKPST